MADDARITELRRRVAADPASIAFAHLAEECRRIGATEEAVAICRKGLVRYPDYLSARVTLGRALIELGRLEEAQEELELVVASAPDSLPAIRGLAEIHQGRGRLETALEYYRRAMGLARHDTELAETVGRIAQVVAPAPPPEANRPVSVEELFDFDALLAQLGEAGGPAQAAPAPSAPAPLVLDPPKPRPLILARPPQPVEPVEPVEPAEPLEPVGPAPNPFAALEIELRVKSNDRARRERDARNERRRRLDAAMLAPLEAWLSAIVADRERHARP